MKSAHPRVCGENRRPAKRKRSRSGSPPRVRGKRRSCRPRGPSRRLTPACAGKTGPCLSRYRRAGAHPRVCGENCVICVVSRSQIGSPPRVRGKRARRRSTCVRSGLTPACAGKTPGGRRAWTSSAAHPRVCGENWRATLTGSRAPGSPPRVRGKRQIDGVDADRGRLTPACAGKTRAPLALPKNSSAHPRVCGENLLMRFRNDSHLGSPPRVRGKPHRRDRRAVRGGLTPACAGKTTTRLLRRLSFRAHPRVCGENVKSVYDWVKNLGSPPRVRGKRHAT